VRAGACAKQPKENHMLPIHEQLDLWVTGTCLSTHRSAPALAEERGRMDVHRLLNEEAFLWLATFDGGQNASL
jgi:hypothetical protein